MQRREYEKVTIRDDGEVYHLADLSKRQPAGLLRAPEGGESAVFELAKHINRVVK